MTEAPAVEEPGPRTASAHRSSLPLLLDAASMQAEEIGTKRPECLELCTLEYPEFTSSTSEGGHDVFHDDTSRSD